LGSTMATVGTFCGVGCMVGPSLGGVLYDWADTMAVGDWWHFLFPFLIFGVFTALLGVAVMVMFPNAKIASDEEAAPIMAVMSPSVILGLVAVGISGTVVAAHDPTLDYRLGKDSVFGESSTEVGLWFTFSSIVYTAISIPVGWIVDKYEGNSFVFKACISAGFFALFLGFALLGPMSLPGVADTTAFDNLFWVAFAMTLKGIGSAVSVNPVYPDLMVGISEDDAMASATISGLWNAAYSVGWAAGPLIGGVLYDAEGFDGFSTWMALICLAYAVLMLAAAFMGIAGTEVSSTENNEYSEVKRDILEAPEGTGFTPRTIFGSQE